MQTVWSSRKPYLTLSDKWHNFHNEHSEWFDRPSSYRYAYGQSYPSTKDLPANQCCIGAILMNLYILHPHGQIYKVPHLQSDISFHQRDIESYQLDENIERFILMTQFCLRTDPHSHIAWCCIEVPRMHSTNTWTVKYKGLLSRNAYRRNSQIHYVINLAQGTRGFLIKICIAVGEFTRHQHQCSIGRHITNHGLRAVKHAYQYNPFLNTYLCWASRNLAIYCQADIIPLISSHLASDTKG